MKKPSGFYSSLGLLILLNAIIKPVWIFAIDRQVQNVVGIETYGIYFSLLGLSVVFSFLADWGFTGFFNRQLAASEENFFRLPGKFLLLKLLFALLYGLVIFIAAWLSGVKRWDILFYVVLIQIFTSLFVFLRAIITAQQWFKTDAWLSIADKGLMIITCGILLWFPLLAGSITLERFLFLQTASLAIATILAFIFLVKKGVHFSIPKKWLPDRKLLAQALPFGITVLLMSMHARLDAFLLERMNTNGPYQAGIYAAAYRLLDASNMAGYLVVSFMLPFIARRWSKQEEITTVIHNCRHFLLMLATGIIITIVSLAPWIQRVLYHHNDVNAIEVLRWCLPALAGYSLVQIYGTVLTATGRIMDFFFINLGCVVVNIVLNLILIPAWGAKGCCIAAISSQFLCGIATMLYVKQKMGVSLHIRSLLIYIFTAILLSGFFYLCKDWPVGKWMLIIVAMMITVAVMLTSKLAGLSQWIGSWKKQNG
ncbi:MAG: polysaccharide biosynthesis C-terminal domain-containing protein [Chitinophagaceae bacterium]